MLKQFLKLIFIQFFKKKFKSTIGNKEALVSYIVHPFLHLKGHEHPNAIEVKIIVDSLLALGFNVTVVDYRRRLIKSNFDLVFGFGGCYEASLKYNCDAIFILYATGAPFTVNNTQTMKAWSRFSGLTSAMPSFKSEACRLVESNWHQLVLSDFVIAMGENHHNKLFLEYFSSSRIFMVPSICYAPTQLAPLLPTPEKPIFLWFGGKGVVHKGLDLCIKAFQNIDAKLIIAGPIDNEIKWLQSILEFPENVEYVGFLPVGSKEFNAVLAKCDFVLLPSASEALATSVVTACSWGGLIPVVSKHCGFNEQFPIITLPDLNAYSLIENLKTCCTLSAQERLSRKVLAQKLFTKTYSVENFLKQIQLALQSAVEKGKK